MADFELYRCRIASYKGEDFVDKIPTICQELHSELGVLTFAIILYDETTPDFRKMLRDQDYWDALDKASGQHMVVFVLKDERIHEVKLHCMIGFYGTSRDREESYSQLLKHVFDTEALLVFPSVLFFQVVGTDVYDYRLVPLRRQTESESAKAVQQLFEIISSVLSGIREQHYKNQREIFAQVKNELINRDFRLLVLTGPKRLADFISTVRTLTFT